MPYIPISYIGWAEEWFDDDGQPKVGEIFIKCFVNRYFAFPEDWDDDDVPLIMIWVRCITCGFVKEHFMRETEKEWLNFIYNRDNTYTFLSEPECDDCRGPGTYNPMFREERSNMVEEEYRYMFPEEKNSHFGSAIEEYFWKTWKATFSTISLIPQYQIGNYYVDFAHIPTKTVIELDGKPYHTTPYQIANDEERQKSIERQGWHVLRFTGGDIYYHVDRCIIDTLRFLSEAQSGFVIDAQDQWWSLPSARLLKRLKERDNSLLVDVP